MNRRKPSDVRGFFIIEYPKPMSFIRWWYLQTQRNSVRRFAIPFLNISATEHVLPFNIRVSYGMADMNVRIDLSDISHVRSQQVQFVHHEPLIAAETRATMWIRLFRDVYVRQGTSPRQHQPVLPDIAIVWLWRGKGEKVIQKRVDRLFIQHSCHSHTPFKPASQ